jgi:GNAT superfamily N-acetyltransferase
MIRPLLISELDMVHKMAREWYASSEVLKNYRPDVFRKTWTHLLMAGTGIIMGLFHGDVFCGAIGGIIHPDINNGDPTATEFFWYMGKEYRGEGMSLLNAFESWAREYRCKTIKMTRLMEGPEVLDRIYRKKKYYPIEMIYQKEL